MQKRDGRVDPSFQFNDIDPKTGERRPIARHEDVLRMLRDFSPVRWTFVASSSGPGGRLSRPPFFCDVLFLESGPVLNRRISTGLAALLERARTGSAAVTGVR
jgi:hypothetical protein